jgi:hypothetical protein
MFLSHDSTRLRRATHPSPSISMEKSQSLGPELEPVVPDQANRTATARVVERQFIGRDEPEEPAEGPGGQLVILTFCRKCCTLV